MLPDYSVFSEQENLDLKPETLESSDILRSEMFKWSNCIFLSLDQNLDIFEFFMALSVVTHVMNIQIFI